MEQAGDQHLVPLRFDQFRERRKLVPVNVKQVDAKIDGPGDPAITAVLERRSFLPFFIGPSAFLMGAEGEK